MNRPAGPRQSFCIPMFRVPGLDDERLLAEAAAIGYDAVECWWPDAGFADLTAAARRQGLRLCSFTAQSTLGEGIANRGHHPRLRCEIAESIRRAADLGVAGVIVLSGNREDGIADEAQRAAAAALLAELAPLAEHHGVTLNLEVLNSRIDHPGYVCDRLEWALDITARVGSPRVKVLLDLYHRQIMEGDVIRALRAHSASIGHIHTAGNPGRGELDASQEMDYRGIAAALAATPYAGWVGHEFRPRGDPLAALRQAYAVFAG